MESSSSTKDISLLSRCSEEDARLFMHKLIDSMCGRSSPSYSDFSSTWSLEEWWNILDSCRALVTLFFSRNWSSQQLSEHISSVLPPTYEKLVCEALCVRCDDIKHCLTDGVAHISHASLTDFDWTTKLTVSSDRLASVWQPLTQLDLTLSQRGEQKRVQVELDQTELKKLITSLEAADRIASQLT